MNIDSADSYSQRFTIVVDLLKGPYKLTSIVAINRIRYLTKIIKD